MYRYRILRSKGAADKGTQPFSHRLNHLLNWETNSPIPNPYPLEQEQHSISLLNTLSLIALTDQIIFTKNTAAIANETVSSPKFHNTFTDRSFVQLSEVVSCSKAVIRSLNRRSMQRRSTLSWITGFTAIRACLVLDYYAVFTVRGSTCAQLNSMTLKFRNVKTSSTSPSKFCLSCQDNFLSCETIVG